jgi:hypothetical protein
MVAIKENGRKYLREQALIDHFFFLHYTLTLGFPAGRLEKLTGLNYASPGNFWIFESFPNHENETTDSFNLERKEEDLKKWMTNGYRRKGEMKKRVYEKGRRIKSYFGFARVTGF